MCGYVILSFQHHWTHNLRTVEQIPTFKTNQTSWIWDAPQLEAHHHQDKILNPKYMGYKKPLFFIFPKFPDSYRFLYGLCQEYRLRYFMEKKGNSCTYQVVYTIEATGRINNKNSPSKQRWKPHLEE